MKKFDFFCDFELTKIKNSLILEQTPNFGVKEADDYDKRS